MAYKNWSRKFQRLAILKLKEINFTAIKVLYFKKMQILRKYQYFICRKDLYLVGYLYNDHYVKSLHIMLRKTSAYVKSYNDFLIEDDDLLEKYII